MIKLNYKVLGTAPFLHRIIIYSIWYCLQFQNWLLQIFHKVLFSNLSTISPKHILLFRVGSLGDSVCTLPIFTAIRKQFPHATISLLTHTGVKVSGKPNLVALNELLPQNFLAETINYDFIPKWQLIKKLQTSKYDFVFELTQSKNTFSKNLRNMFFFRSCHINSAGQWDLIYFPWFRQWQEKYFLFPQETERLAHLAQHSGFVVNQIDYSLDTSKTDEKVVDAILAQLNFDNVEHNVAFVVGANRPQNRWSITYFEEVATYLTHHGYRIFLVGSQADLQLTANFRSKGVINLCGRMNIMQTAYFLKKMRLVLTNDTGPMHVAYAVQTPVIALFSARDFSNLWFPPPEHIVLTDRTVPCAICLSEVCNDNICMKRISPQQVIEKLNVVLQLS